MVVLHLEHAYALDSRPVQRTVVACRNRIVCRLEDDPDIAGQAHGHLSFPGSRQFVASTREVPCILQAIRGCQIVQSTIQYVRHVSKRSLAIPIGFALSLQLLIPEENLQLG